ncbi:PRTase-like protein [Rhizopogon vinicolor AM-OR11-026]|uniref:PRTase-like protein n=1 Tax=Rhizopogon vinicolor AM-OR11-026 TaxID=1314800 RepID=A0A1B7N5A9_9AGAM|nr:PRTase-like protein [Rhizopogon vinicolor AM-OR11-026]
MSEPVHLWATYNDIHNIIRATADKIASEFKPDMFVAIVGGGFLPARVLRTFLKDPSTAKTIPIKAIGLSLYEPLPGTTAEQCGTEVVRTQWLGPDSGKTLLGRRVLIIDDVDATRKTLQYALSELQKDVESELQSLPESERDSKRTQFAIFVVHNKLILKLWELPLNVPYFAGADVGDVWIEYPWQAIDIEEHDRLTKEDKEKRNAT